MCSKCTILRSIVEDAVGIIRPPKLLFTLVYPFLLAIEDLADSSSLSHLSDKLFLPIELNGDDHVTFVMLVLSKTSITP